MLYSRITIFALIFFLLTFATSYLSMRNFADQPAASCMDCSYLKDVFFFSLFSILIIPIVLFILDKRKINTLPLSLIISAVFLLTTFINNLNLFKDRVSSWSSYGTKDEIVATVAQSYPYMITGSIVIFFIFYKMYRRDKASAEN